MHIEYNTPECKRLINDEIKAEDEFGYEARKTLLIVLKLFNYSPTLNYIHNTYNNACTNVPRFTPIFISGTQMLSLFLSASYTLIIMPLKHNNEPWTDLVFPDDLIQVTSIKIMEVRKNEPK